MSNSKFIEAAEKERFAFHKFITDLNIFQTENWHIYVTQSDGMDKYDILISEIINGSVKKRLFIEIKNRVNLDLHIQNRNALDGWFIEKQKYNSLLKYVKEDERNEAMYLNFTQRGVFLWKLKEDMGEVVKHKVEYSQCVSKGKVDKSMILLQEQDAKYYDFIFRERDFYDFKRSLVKKKIEVKRNYGFNF